MSVTRIGKTGGPQWQYHPRSDHHSKVACWGVLFDLLQHSEVLRMHAEAGLVAFGINHTMTNFTNGKKKALDLVLCRPQAGGRAGKSAESFAGLVRQYAIALSDSERGILAALPEIQCRPVGAVRIALEAKAIMTEFAKARPRLYDELSSSQTIVHGDTNEAIAAGLVIINGSSLFISPTRNANAEQGIPIKATHHDQPKQLGITVDHVRGLPRRADTSVPGFDALGVVILNVSNVQGEAVSVVTEPPAPQPGDVLHYESLINRLAGSYSARFPAG